jgi:hypothetical protein
MLLSPVASAVLVGGLATASAGIRRRALGIA